MQALLPGSVGSFHLSGFTCLPCNCSGTTRLNLSVPVSLPELGVISVVVRIKLVNIMEAFKTALGTQ